VSSLKKSVFITGATGGIGLALCQGFAEQGYRVIASGRSEKTAELADFDYVRCDLSKVGTSAEAADQVKEEVVALTQDAPLRVLINNAAIQILGATEAITLDEFNISLAVNVAAPFALTQRFAAMLAAENGCVLNIGTVHAQSTKPGFAAYATSKTAMHGLTRATAVDLGGRVRVNTLAPAATRTPMLMAGFEGNPEAFAALSNAHPAKRIALPKEIADAALFMCSEAAGFMTGTTLYMDGGVLSRLHDPL
jgi:NAD(P)-dependent dehydrogenase (short-subunit alcohol dehydrogenase family)